MIKFRLISYLLLISLSTANAQLNLIWQGIIDDGSFGNENSSISVYDTNGFVYTIGTMRPWGFNTSDLVLAKYDLAGNELWRTFYSGPSGKNEKINDAVLDQNGDLILCGEYFNVSNKNDILVMKYSSAGGFLWMDTIDGPTNLYEQGAAVCVDDANNYYFAGYTSAGSVKGILVKYSPSGQQLWSKTYTGSQQCKDVMFYKNRVYLNCMMGPTGSPTSASLIKLDTAGNMLDTLSLNLFYGDFISNTVLADDKIYLVDQRTFPPPTGSQYGIVCADTSMQILWDISFSAGYLSESTGLSLSDTVLFVTHTEYPNQNLQSSSVKLRGISALTGDSLFMSTLTAPVNQKNVALAQTMDQYGRLSVFMSYELAPGVQRFQLTQANSSGVQTGNHLFYDIPGFGNHTLISDGANQLVVMAAVYDSIANNTNISTWLFSSPVGGITSASSDNFEVKAGPVPARSQLQLYGLPDGEFRYAITSISGQLVQEGKLAADHQLLLNISPGYYLLKLFNESNVFGTTFIKE